MSEITIGSINLLQTPMLTKPRSIDSDEWYYP